MLMPAAFLSTCLLAAPAATVHHYVFFNRDRERITNASFLNTKAFDGAQLKYTWRELERQKGDYDFTDIEHDLSLLQSKGKKLFIQLQDASFQTNIILVPRYILSETQYHGGVDRQYRIEREDEDQATPYGWVARRWDPAVQERFHKLLLALGSRFDGRIEGLNLPETAVDFGHTGKLFPAGFAPDVYCKAVLTNIAVLKRAFPRSVAMQYANFITGGRGNLERVYRHAKELRVALGGPDLLPYQPNHMSNCYSLLHEYSGAVMVGVAVQDGNYEFRNPRTGHQVTISELIQFGTEYLGASYIFWCTEEPCYSNQLIPFLNR